LDRLADKLASALSNACTGFPILGGVLCFFGLLFTAIGLLHVLGILFIPFCFAFLCADVSMWVRVRGASAKRLWRESGFKGVITVFSDKNTKVDLFQSAIDTNYEAIDFQGSSIIARIFEGKPSVKFLSCYNPSKGGHLSPKFVVFGRRALACSLFALTFPPTFAIGACLAPLAPLFLIPLVFYPRDPVPRHMAPLISPLVGGFIYVLFAYLLPLASQSIANVFSPHQVGYLPALFPALFALVMSWKLWRSPALSSCACCAPAWLFAYSMPLALLIGRNKARSYLAFSPVPDMPLQLPTMFVMIFFEHYFED
jgi:hypothetical protein